MHAGNMREINRNFAASRGDSRVLRGANIVVALLLLGGRAFAGEATDINFGRHILPILAENCFQCHGPDEKARKAKLRLDTREGSTAQRGEAAAIVPGNIGKSELLRRVASADADEVMPP